MQRSQTLYGVRSSSALRIRHVPYSMLFRKASPPACLSERESLRSSEAPTTREADKRRAPPGPASRQVLLQRVYSHETSAPRAAPQSQTWKGHRCGDTQSWQNRPRWQSEHREICSSHLGMAQPAHRSTASRPQRLSQQIAVVHLCIEGIVPHHCPRAAPDAAPDAMSRSRSW